MNKAFEKILERLEADEKHTFDGCINKRYVKRILQEVAEEFADDTNVGHKWIPCSERLPKNAYEKGTICPRYYIMTKYGVTEGWYNPDFNSWYVLIWFMTGRCINEEIDLERGDVPKVVKVPLESGIVTAWQPLPEPYKESELR